jgi:dipeptidyl aminopeptidase/acylaminoacyl peptidase
MKRVPLDVLLGNPERAVPQISPDGKRLAYIAPDEGVLNVWVGDIDGEDFRPVTHDRERGIGGLFWIFGFSPYFWAHDNRHLIYIQDQGGNENFRVYRVEPETRETTDLTPFEGVQAQIIATKKRFPNEILVGLNKENPALHDVYRLDIAGGELTKVAENTPELAFGSLFGAWIIDEDLRVRGGIRQTPDGGLEVLVRETEDAEWEPALKIEFEDALLGRPLRFTGDGKGLWLLTSAGADTTRLVRYDLATRESTEVASDPHYDVSDAVFHPDTHEPQLALVIKDRSTHIVLDSEISDDVEAIRSLDTGDFSLLDRDHADQRWTVQFTSDDAPPTYYVYDRSTKRGRRLFNAQPSLESYDLAKMEPFSFASRDGLTLHGYLSFPPSAGRDRLPTVIFPHGGPWGRDTWGFFPWSQFIATRGHLCVQVDFRGSTGYGKAFVNAGDREWGAKMHDDLVDTVRYVVDQGYADADRVGIFGVSYGGYASLVAAAFTPDLFRCAASMVGPSSLVTLLESIPPYWEPIRALFNKRVGNVETERDFLWERSPLSKVDQIKIPMLVGQGANDPRVKQAESEQIVAALKERGIEHEYLLFDDEGHGFVKPENNVRFFEALEEFLDRHLAGRM